MDPEVVYKEMISAAKKIIKNEGQFSEESVDLAAAVLNMDTWIKGGGFLPHKWQYRK